VGAVVTLAACLSAAPAAVGHEVALVPPLDFDPPRPGTYTLHRIMRAPDGEVLGLDGHGQRLSHFTRGRITLLGFIYTTCTDPDGCPLAYRVFERMKQTVAAAPALSERVQLVTLSFDPLRDTPAAMRQYAGSRVNDEGRGPRWYFLTTRSARELVPLVEGFGQDVRHTIDRSNGRPRRELSHVLKVFLIDPAGFVREIYTSTFLHPQTVLNDIETLLMEGQNANELRRLNP
jgi:protein SCO1/2